ncbi:PTS sugar transporter subunit IIB [Lactobacillus gallinarum]|jgi:PTS system ascorbate-specific IIB component|uniref:PTS ascorbate transporter subunit IIB n=1 Tax=Lactobacillus gallinarum TaxID=52242 RepID=A0A1Y4W6V8_9LACO|nr:PTS sugar transporter subunit IIB [Lactobacillus gallinarum]OUQ78139.1 PTS ascorbate transporter subunit IIB [Lactobacillus gallinarum]
MKILAVCGFGVGSSMVLKMTLDKVCHEIGLDADVSNTDLETAKATKADVYFTSAELAPDIKSSTSNPVIPIKKYMDKDEVKAALQKYLDSKKAE